MHGGYLDRLTLTSGECFVLEMVIDNLKTTPNQVTNVLEEIESRLLDQELKTHWLADEEDGYKGDSERYSVHNTSGYLPPSSPNKSTPAPNAPRQQEARNHHPSVKIHEDSLPLYPGMPSEV